MIGPASRSGDHEMHRAAAQPHAGVERLLLDVQALEGGQQRRVDVDRSGPPSAPGNHGLKIRMKPARTTSSDAMPLQLGRHGAIEGLAVGDGRDGRSTAVAMPASGRDLEAGRVGALLTTQAISAG